VHEEHVGASVNDELVVEFDAVEFAGQIAANEYAGGALAASLVQMLAKTSPE